MIVIPTGFLAGAFLLPLPFRFIEQNIDFRYVYVDGEIHYMESYFYESQDHDHFRLNLSHVTWPTVEPPHASGSFYRHDCFLLSAVAEPALFMGVWGKLINSNMALL